MDIKNNTVLVIDEGIEDDFALDYDEDLLIAENLILAKTIYNMYLFHSNNANTIEESKASYDLFYNTLINYGFLLEKFTNISRKFIKEGRHYVDSIENNQLDLKNYKDDFVLNKFKDYDEQNNFNSIRSIINALPSELYDLIEFVIRIFENYGEENVKILFSENNDEKNVNILISVVHNIFNDINNFTKYINNFIKNVLEIIKTNFELLLRIDVGYINTSNENNNMNVVYDNLYRFFRKIKEGGSYINKKYKNRCFAIMEADDDLFYTFSSIYDYVGENHAMNDFIKCSQITIDMGKYKNYICKNILKSSKFRYAHLTDNVKRYVEYNGFGLCRKMNKDEYSLLKDDANNPIFSQYISACYSCCERKLIEKLSRKDYSSIKFYIRYIPCEMCIFPVQKLINRASNVEIYARYKSGNDEESKKAYKSKGYNKTYHLKIDYNGI